MASTRCRLLRKFLNFVFLRRKMYINTSTEQKTKKRQKYRKLDVCGTFTIPPSAINRTHLPLHKGGIKRLIYFIGVVQELYLLNSSLEFVINCLERMLCGKAEFNRHHAVVIKKNNNMRIAVNKIFL